MDIPIIVICYNNYKFVKNTLKQIKKINENYYKNIFIMNNCSTCPKTIDYLNQVDVKIIQMPANIAPQVDPERNVDLYNQLPEKFILTDPDLEFNENLPSNFIDILVDISERFQCYKVGFALDISDWEKMYQYEMIQNEFSVYGFEKIFWYNKIVYNNLDLYYNAGIDTTFGLNNKKFYIKNVCNQIRVACNFTAKHLPWYYDSKVINVYDKYLIFNTNHVSTCALTVLRHINENYEKINKNDEFFFIDKKDDNLNFWINRYSNWEVETFAIFDKYLSKDKIMIDIGASIGVISMYGSRKSKYIYAIESDTKKYEDLCLNMKNNCDDNYTLINNNYEHIIKDYLYPNLNKISIIKVDILGSEELILNDLLEFYEKHKIPMLISFYYDLWNNKDISRFKLLSDEYKSKIKQTSLISILFT
jgi:hypothetical protein